MPSCAPLPSLPADAECLAGLRYSIERYLPVSGPCYEQCAFTTIVRVLLEAETRILYKLPEQVLDMLNEVALEQGR